MSTYIGQGKQALNIHYGQDVTYEYLNHILKEVITPGVLWDGENHNSFSVEIGNNSTIINIGILSLIITPINIDYIRHKVDTTSTFTKTWIPQLGRYLIARYEWNDSKLNAVEFLFVKSPEKNDVVLLKLTENNELDFSEQTHSNLNLINKFSSYDNADFVDCYESGNESNKIPLNNNILNENLNTQFINSLSINDLSINNNTLQENLSTTFVQGYSLQPQNLNMPGEYNQIPISNGTLQLNLNAQYLNNKELDYYISENHTHFYSYINDTEEYKKVINVNENNKLTSESIKEDVISNKKIKPFGYDLTTKSTYTPVFESGTIGLEGTEVLNVLFTRNIKNPRVFIQKIFGPTITDEIAKYSERTAYIFNITNNGFSVRQFPPFVVDDTIGNEVNGNNPIIHGDEELDGGLTRIYEYEWVVIGERN